jgi:hypothetical protein
MAHEPGGFLHESHCYITIKDLKMHSLGIPRLPGAFYIQHRLPMTMQQGQASWLYPSIQRHPEHVVSFRT